jgi:L-arabinose isomerase
MVDMGNRFRLLVNEVEAVESKNSMPKLPVARVLWKPLPDFSTACSAWILAGGAHHTVYSQSLSSEHLEDFAEMAGIEMLLIDKKTTISHYKSELRWNELYYAERK